MRKTDLGLVRNTPGMYFSHPSQLQIGRLGADCTWTTAPLSCGLSLAQQCLGSSQREGMGIQAGTCPEGEGVGCRGHRRGSAVFPGGDSLGSGCVLPVPRREAQRELRGSEESHGAGWVLA